MIDPGSKDKVALVTDANHGIGAAEISEYGITVNAVRPGATQTGYITPESEGWIVAESPPGRLGEPKDVADVIVFLASEQGRSITGQLIAAGGELHQDWPAELDTLRLPAKGLRPSVCTHLSRMSTA